MVCRSGQELAYRYDLYVVPVWREQFDAIVEKHVALPKEGHIIEVNSGTGSLALELAVRMGTRGEVLATDESAERLAIARRKASAKRLGNITFLQKDPTNLGLDENSFSLAIGDATLSHPHALDQMIAGMGRVSHSGATVALKLLTRGSFDEFYSVLWEALHDCGLSVYSSDVEALARQLPTLSDVQLMLTRGGLKNAHCFVERKEFHFETASDFFESPLVEDYFLDDWFAFLPNADAAEQVRRQAMRIIDQERGHSYFDFSVKATLAIGRKE